MIEKMFSLKDKLREQEAQRQKEQKKVKSVKKTEKSKGRITKSKKK